MQAKENKRLAAINSKILQFAMFAPCSEKRPGLYLLIYKNDLKSFVSNLSDFRNSEWKWSNPHHHLARRLWIFFITGIQKLESQGYCGRRITFGMADIGTYHGRKTNSFTELVNSSKINRVKMAIVNGRLPLYSQICKLLRLIEIMMTSSLDSLDYYTSSASENIK